MTWLKLDTSKHPLSWVVKLSQRAIDYPALHNGSRLRGAHPVAKAEWTQGEAKAPRRELAGCEEGPPTIKDWLADRIFDAKRGCPHYHLNEARSAT